MPNDMTKKFHFVGIGGAGMSAIAKILLEKGCTVTGSDLTRSEPVLRLERLGAKIFAGHEAGNIENADIVIRSTAIADDNPEIIAAREKGLSIIHRADMLASLMNDSLGIAVAGAHGKTTTTSIIALMLEKSGVDPTVVIGGDLDYFGGNAKLGTGPVFGCRGR